VRRYLPEGVGYEGGDYHPPHTDWFETEKGDSSNVLIISMLLYLTSPEKGGTTYFPFAWHNGTKGEPLYCHKMVVVAVFPMMILHA